MVKKLTINNIERQIADLNPRDLAEEELFREMLLVGLSPEKKHRCERLSNFFIERLSKGMEEEEDKTTIDDSILGLSLNNETNWDINH